jgi:hypothetical protein
MLEEEGANVLGRDSDEYRKNYYRAHWQPTCAITGLVGCTLIVLFSGWPAIYLLKEKNTLSTASDLKGTLDLVGDIIGAYSGVRPNIPLLDDAPSPWLTAQSLAVSWKSRDSLSALGRHRSVESYRTDWFSCIYSCSRTYRSELFNRVLLNQPTLAGIVSYSILAIQVRKRDELSKVKGSRACISCA